MDISTYDKFCNIISGAIRSLDNAPGGSRTRLGVLFGSSTLEDGVDPTVLSRESGGAQRWLSLYGHNMSIGDMDYLYAVFQKSRLRAETLILAIDPGAFAHNAAYLQDSQQLSDFSDVPRLLLKRRFRDALDSFNSGLLTPLNRLLPNRTRVNYTIRRRLNDLKLKLIVDGGLGGIESVYAPAPDPWVVPPRRNTLHSPVADFKDQYEYLLAIKCGWFDPEKYDPRGQNAEAFVRLITRARSRGTRVSIVLLPEPSEQRKRIPPEADACIHEILNDRFAGDPPPVIDLRAAIDDHYFHDFMHLNSEGRRLFSDRLAALLAEGTLFPGEVAASARIPLDPETGRRRQDRAVAR